MNFHIIDRKSWELIYLSQGHKPSLEAEEADFEERRKSARLQGLKWDTDGPAKSMAAEPK